MRCDWGAVSPLLTRSEGPDRDRGSAIGVLGTAPTLGSTGTWRAVSNPGVVDTSRGCCSPATIVAVFAFPIALR
ncbi:MAG: hypothetical protein JWP48_4318 [Actinoallomurus sp.]|jgi:hypothetical protein|nr:hypothetical protein [Actinoallomurus sp.]